MRTNLEPTGARPALRGGTEGRTARTAGALTHAALVVLLSTPLGVAYGAPIHPGLLWLRYLGGSGTDQVQRVAHDAQGNLWIAGTTSDPSTWQSNSVSPSRIGPGGGMDAFVARLDAQGALTLLVFVGGSGDDFASSLVCDRDGGVVVVGTTDSVDFPTTPGALESQLSGDSDAFITRLDAEGNLQWSTLLGGSSSDAGVAVSAMADGSVVVGGSTWSADFPAVNALQGPGPAFQSDGFIAVLSAGGDRLELSTYLGGSSSDGVRDVAVDRQGNILAAGETASPDFPVKQPYQGSLADGPTLCGGDAFVTKLSWPAPQIAFSTYLGGAQGDVGESVAVEEDDSTTVVGTTLSPDFPWTAGGYLGPPGAINLFVARMASNGSSLTYSARLPLTASAGGPGCPMVPRGFRVALDGQGRSWLVGSTSVTDFPIVNPLQAQLNGSSDGLIGVLTADGAQLAFSTYLGGGAADALRDVAMGPGGDVLVAGDTSSPDLAASQGSYRGGGDVFVARISTTAAALSASVSASPLSGLAPLGVSFSGSASGGTGLYSFDWDFGDGSPQSSRESPTHTYALGGSYTATLIVTDSGGATAPASVVISVAHNCTLACDASVPLAVATGDAASFAGSATAGDCVGGVSSSWSFGDGGRSTEQSPSHVYSRPGLYDWSLQTSVGSVSCSRGGTIAATTAPLNAAYTIPAVAHNPGYAGTSWRSDVAIVNVLSSPATAHLTLVFRGGGRPPLFAIATLAAGATVDWRDVLVSLLGLAESDSAAGALAVYSDRAVAITSRTCDLTPAGTLGASYPPLTASDGLTAGATAVLGGLRRTAAFRTNIGAVNLGEQPCTVVVTLHASDGEKVGAPQTMRLAPGGWQQLNDALAIAGSASVDLAYATLVVQTEGGVAWVYASVIDNATGDPTTVSAILLE
jgi:PKD repeat protein